MEKPYNRRKIVVAGTIGLAGLLMSPSASSLQPSPPPLPPSNDAPRTAYLSFQMGITQETMLALEDSLVNVAGKGFNHICLMINSGGGSVSAALSMYEIITSLYFDITTCALSDVDSAAIILYLSGKTRLASPQSIFGFHSAAHQFSGGDDLIPDQIESIKSILAEDNTRLKEIYQSKLRIPVEDYDKYFLGSLRRVRTKEATDIGLITDAGGLHIKKGDALFYVSVPTVKDQY